MVEMSKKQAKATVELLLGQAEKLREKMAQDKEALELVAGKLMLAMTALNADVVESPTIRASYVKPTKSSVNVKALVKVLDYEGFVKVARVSVTKLAKAVTEEQFSKLVKTTDGTPYLRFTKPGEDTDGEAE